MFLEKLRKKIAHKKLLMAVGSFFLCSPDCPKHHFRFINSFIQPSRVESLPTPIHQHFFTTIHQQWGDFPSTDFINNFSLFYLTGMITVLAWLRTHYLSQWVRPFLKKYWSQNSLFDLRKRRGRTSLHK